MSWDKEYSLHGKLWGKGPSILGLAGVAYLRKHRAGAQTLEILDIGCGYGRDALHFAENLDCRVEGIDTSERAVEAARNEAAAKRCANIDFQCRDFRERGRKQYDAVFISNLYQLLQREERRQLRDAAAEALKTGGLLFLSTLSVSDPEHYGKGTPVVGETDSFDDGKFLHFCTKRELTIDFSFLDVRELYEQEYDEPRSNGETHHHISWILVGERLATVKG